MEVDTETTYDLNIERLMSFQIYNDADFPLKLRSLMEPVIKQFNLYDAALDFEAEDEQTSKYVDDICQNAYQLLLSHMSEIPRSSTEYIGVREIYTFLKNVEPRQLMETLSHRLTREKEMMNTSTEDVVEENLRRLEDIHDEVSKQLRIMISVMENQSKRIDRLDQLHLNVVHNKGFFDRQVRGRPANVGEDVVNKLKMQKETYLRDVHDQRETLKSDCDMMSRMSVSLMELIEKLTNLSNESQMNIRIRNMKILPSLIGNVRRIFSSIKENLTKLKCSIDFFTEKIDKSVSYSCFQAKYPDMKHIIDSINHSKTILLRNSVVVSVEPQFSMRCLKKDKKLNNYELMVLLEKVMISKANISAFLLTETGLRRIKNEISKGKFPDASSIMDSDLGGQFRSNIATLEHDSGRGGYKLTFKDLTITVASRKHKANVAVTQQKHVIVFLGTIEIDQQVVRIQCFSLPVIVAVHGNQTSKSLAAIFWDDYFHKKTRSGLEVDHYVDWLRMSTALCHLFNREVDREPTASNLSYLKERLMSDIPSNHDITFEAFSKTSTKDNKLPFWEWLWGTMQVLINDPSLLNLWKSNYIVGYINQMKAKVLLNQYRPNPDVPLSDENAERLFLIRFSESRKELITIQGHLYDQKLSWGVYSVKPYTTTDLRSISLSRRILDREDCGFVFYEVGNKWCKRPKSEVFMVEPDAPQSSLPYGYIDWALKERTGDSDIRKYRLESNDDNYSNASDIMTTELMNNDEEFEGMLSVESLIDYLHRP